MKPLQIFTLLFLLLIANNFISQNDCKNNLKTAQDLYSEGEYDNCIQLSNTALSTCFYTKKEKEDFYELLIKAYLEADNLTEADNNVKKLLNSNPAYEVQENLSTEDYSRLIKKFSVHPLFSIGIRNTALRPSFKSTKVFKVFLEDVDYAAPYTTTKTLLMYYGWIEYQFIKTVSLNAEFTGLNIDYRREFSKPNWEMSYKEKMTFLETPLYLKKYFQVTKSIFPYVSAGLSYLKLLRSNGTAQLEYTTESHITGVKTVNSSQLSDINMLGMRKQNSFLWLIGGGIGFKFKNFGLYIDGRYYGGINNLTNTSNRFSNNSLINDYFYIDNSLQLNKFEGGLCISYTLKNSVKKSK